MKRVCLIAGVFLLAAVWAGPTVAAQGAQGGMVEPTPLEASDPRAKEAATVVNLILKGERDAVLTLLREKGTPSFAKSPELQTLVEAQIARLANKGYTVAEFLTGRGADVIVELTAAKGEPTNLVIRFTADSPHRIEGFARAMQQG